MILRPDVNNLLIRRDTRTLIRATRHWSGRIRASTAAALGSLRTENALPELLRLLIDRGTEVREAAARALGDIGRTEAVDPLIEALARLKGLRNDRPGSKEYEFEAIAEALGRLNSTKGVAAVIESGTVRFHEGFFSVSRPHIGGLCLSGGAEARAALVRIAEEHYHYETYSPSSVLSTHWTTCASPRATAALLGILSTFVELLKKPLAAIERSLLRSCDRNRGTLALSAVRALGSFCGNQKRAEPVLIDLLCICPCILSPPIATPLSPIERIMAECFPRVGQALADTQDAILAIRGEKVPPEFNCERASLRIRDYQLRRYQTDIEFGGRKRWSADAGADRPGHSDRDLTFIGNPKNGRRNRLPHHGQSTACRLWQGRHSTCQGLFRRPPPDVAGAVAELVALHPNLLKQRQVEIRDRVRSPNTMCWPPSFILPAPPPTTIFGSG